jgi:probable HAF family extracellular repeat protein
MKVLIVLSILSLALLTAAAASPGETNSLQLSGELVQYEVAQLDSLGGGSSAGFSINDRGWVAGRSNLPGNQIRHATLWRDGVLTDLGTLGTDELRNSVVRWPVKNVRGLVTGISQTDEPDLYNENWSCVAFFPPATGTGYRCLGFKWQNGEMTPLPTLGGTHGFAAGANNAGRIVGWAETTVEDPENCEPPQRFQFLPVVYGPGDDQIRALPLLGDDSSGAATAINDRGQIVGISGICDQAVGRFTARHAVLWDKGEVIDIGNLGGVAWHTPNAINQHGEVVGFSNFSAADGGEYHPHAFHWTEEDGIRDLETLPAPFNDNSDAWGINNAGQVVGRSCDVVGNCHAFLWQDGVMTDLNCLVDPDGCEPEDTLIAAFDIDDFGRITGQAFDDEEGAFVAYVATPVRK